MVVVVIGVMNEMREKRGLGRRKGMKEATRM